MVLLDNQFDGQGGWVSIDVGAKMKDTTLGLDDRSCGDEYLTGRLACGYEKTVKTNVVDEATVRKISAAVIASECDVTG